VTKKLEKKIKALEKEVEELKRLLLNHEHFLLEKEPNSPFYHVKEGTKIV